MTDFLSKTQLYTILKIDSINLILAICTDWDSFQSVSSAIIPLLPSKMAQFLQNWHLFLNDIPMLVYIFI